MIVDVLGPALVWRMGWTLLHSLWQIAGLAAAVAALLVSLRRQSPQLRYVVAYASMAIMFVPLVVTFAIVRSDGSLWSREASNGSSAVAIFSENDVGADPTSRVAATPDSGGTAGAHAAQSDTSRIEAISAAQRWLAQSVPWLVGGWIGGFVLVSLWNLGGWFAALRLRRLTTAPVAAHFQARLAEMAASMRVNRPVQLLESLLVETPMVIGCLRPAILLPATLHTSITAVELDALLAHELAHIRRHDYLANLFQTLAEAVLFYHPAIWWLSSRIRTEREYCCDEVATAHCGRIEYARGLLAIAQGGRAPRVAMTAAGTRASALQKRLRRVLGAPASDGSSWLGGLLLILSLALLLVAGRSFVLADEGQAGASATPTAKNAAAPIGFSDEQKLTLHQGRQEAVAGIRVELDMREGSAAVRFSNTYSVRVDAGLWSTKSAADMWLEYQQGAFAILPHERDVWLSLDGNLPIVIYLGGVGLAKIENVAHGKSLTAVLTFKLLEFPPGNLGDTRASAASTAHPAAEEVTTQAAASGAGDAPGGKLAAAPPKRIVIQEDPEHAARLATEAHEAEKKREVFFPKTRKSGKTSWSNAFRTRFPEGQGRHIVIVQAHLGDRWPVKFPGQSESLFTAEVLDGYDAAITLRIEHSDEVLMLTLARDRSRQIIVGDQRCRMVYASTHIGESEEPPLVDYATIFVEIFPKSTDSAEESRPKQ